MDTDLLRLKDVCRRTADLLNEPQEGLFSWWMVLADNCRILATILNAQGFTGIAGEWEDTGEV